MSEKTAEKSSAHETNSQRSHHPRRRPHKGKNQQGHRVRIARSLEKATVPARAGFECGQDKPYSTTALPGKFRVSMPAKKVRHTG